MPLQDAVPQNKPYGDLNSLVNQNIVVLDVVLQQMSEIEHCRSDLRQSSPDCAPKRPRNEEFKMTMTVPGFPGTSHVNCRAEQTHATNTARENAIASLIVLANIVPVYFSDPLSQSLLITTRR